MYAAVRYESERVGLAQTAADSCDKNPYLPMFATGMLQLESFCAIYKHI